MKTDYTIRSAEIKDLPVLKHIWKNCFDDGTAEIDRFFDFFFDKNSSLIINSDGCDVAAAHLLKIADFVSEEKIIPCPYVYGVGVLPEFRGMGFGAEISRSITGHCLDLGYDICALVPASERLFTFYRENVGYSNYFSLDEHPISISKGPNPNHRIVRIKPDEYSELREGFLSGISHLRFTPRACEYLSELCSASGGGLYMLEMHDGSSAVIAAEINDGSVDIKELLCAADEIDFCSGVVLDFFHVKTGTVRTPGTSKPFGMTSVQLDGTGYFGFAFD